MTEPRSPTQDSAIRKFISDRLGISSPDMQHETQLQRGLKSAAQELGYSDTEEFGHALLAGSIPPDRATDALAGAFTVGETYFFRDTPCFRALETSILPALMENARRERRPLRIWSAGCSSGEEPYSLAILLDRLFPALFPDSVFMLATDINPRVLRRAEEAVYGEWSFRGAPAWLKRQYFESAERGGARLAERIRKSVLFQKANLSESLPAQWTGMAWDLIICRNVLMYLRPAVAARAVRSFRRSLHAEGRFITAPGEIAAGRLQHFTAVQVCGALILRPNALPGRDAENPPDFTSWRAETPGAAEPADAPLAAGKSEPAELCPGPCESSQDASSQSTDRDQFDPHRHLIRGLQLEEEGDTEAALDEFRRAVFLSPQFILARYARANLLRRTGQTVSARREMECVLTELRAMAPSDLLPGSDTLTAGRLAETILVSRLL